MKKIIYIAILITIFIMPVKVNAWCPESELNRLKQVANSATMTYEHLGNGEFAVTLTGLTQEMYIDIVDKIGSYGFTWRGDEPRYREGYKAGEVYLYEFHASEITACSDRHLRTFTLTIPDYNPYSEMDICEDIKEHYLCNKFVDTSEYNVNELYQELEKYKEDKNNGKIVIEPETEEEEFSLFQKAINFIKNKYVLLLSIVAAIGTIGIIIVITIQKKRSII